KDRAAVVVLTNAWFADAQSRIANGITKVILPQPASAIPGDAEALANARTVFDQLRTGTLDRKLLTEDANYYFTQSAQADYRTSLSP
ncbi:hypothetical protein Q0O84_13365, partial [Staphylococcus aureus]|nr:hypothetical protein [Staphylococcus aureus]